jgi:hypothetical protein
MKVCGKEKYSGLLGFSLKNTTYQKKAKEVYAL